MKKTTINLINLQLDKRVKKKISNLGIKLSNYFLIGDWCNLKKNFFKDFTEYRYLDFYQWNNYKKKSKDTKLILQNYSKCINFLKLKLNKVHNKKYSEKFWEILLSRWTFTYIVHVYTRWELVSKINKKYLLNKIITFNFKDDEQFIPENSQHAHFIMQSMKNDFWSIWMFNKIIKFRKPKQKFIKLENKNVKDELLKGNKELFFHEVFNISSNKSIFFE